MSAARSLLSPSVAARGSNVAVDHAGSYGERGEGAPLRLPLADGSSVEGSICCVTPPPVADSLPVAPHAMVHRRRDMARSARSLALRRPALRIFSRSAIRPR